LSDKRFELLQEEIKQLREKTNRRFEEEKRERLDTFLMRLKIGIIEVKKGKAY
jgi:hypothetical protein